MKTPRKTRISCCLSLISFHSAHDESNSIYLALSIILTLKSSITCQKKRSDNHFKWWIGLHFLPIIVQCVTPDEEFMYSYIR